jgi:hypothetical protein
VNAVDFEHQPLMIGTAGPGSVLASLIVLSTAFNGCAVVRSVVDSVAAF